MCSKQKAKNKKIQCKCGRHSFAYFMEFSPHCRTVVKKQSYFQRSAPVNPTRVESRVLTYTTFPLSICRIRIGQVNKKERESVYEPRMRMFSSKTHDIVSIILTFFMCARAQYQGGQINKLFSCNLPAVRVSFTRVCKEAFRL